MVKLCARLLLALFLFLNAAYIADEGTAYQVVISHELNAAADQAIQKDGCYRDAGAHYIRRASVSRQDVVVEPADVVVCVVISFELYLFAIFPYKLTRYRRMRVHSPPGT